MGTTTDKINAILNTKENMKHKFNEKGVDVDDSVPFSEYPNKMDELSGGDNMSISNSQGELFKSAEVSQLEMPDSGTTYIISAVTAALTE